MSTGKINISSKDYPVTEATGSSIKNIILKIFTDKLSESLNEADGLNYGKTDFQRKYLQEKSEVVAYLEGKLSEEIVLAEIETYLDKVFSFLEKDSDYIQRTGGITSSNSGYFGNFVSASVFGYSDSYASKELPFLNTSEVKFLSSNGGLRLSVNDIGNGNVDKKIAEIYSFLSKMNSLLLFNIDSKDMERGWSGTYESIELHTGLSIKNMYSVVLQNLKGKAISSVKTSKWGSDLRSKFTIQISYPDLDESIKLVDLYNRKIDILSIGSSYNLVRRNFYGRLRDIKISFLGESPGSNIEFSN